MATVNVTLHTGAYLSASDPDYLLGRRAAYKVVIPFNDATQATIDAAAGGPVTLAGMAASSWARAVQGGTEVALSSPPSGLSVSVGPVTPEHAATGLRRISFTSTPPGADHSTTWVGWATLGSVWQGVPAVDPGDIPGDYSSPGTGLAILAFANLGLSGTPAAQDIARPYYVSVPNSSVLGFEANLSVSCRGSFKIPAAGSYRFIVNSDDGCRMWVNGVPAVDDWVVGAGPRFSGAFEFTLDQIVNIRVDNFNTGGDGGNRYSLWLQWSVDGAPYVDIPESVMYPIGWEEPVLDAPRPLQTTFGVDVVSRYF